MTEGRNNTESKETKKGIATKSQVINIQEAVSAIKSAILQGQLSIAKEANRELLSVYYGIGQFISIQSRKHAWGKGAIENISDQLSKELPGLRGFSATNLKRMRAFYETWCPTINRPLPADDLTPEHTTIDIRVLSTLPLAVGNIEWADFLSISFTHHYEIIVKTKTIEERMFYIRQSVKNKWNKDRLIEEIKSDLFHHQSTLPNNFNNTIPSKASALKTMEMFKDNYLLDFINMEELNARDKMDVDERVLEQKIVQHIKDFIMTFGTDFTFVGNQYHLEKYGVEQFPDLLFFNRELSALVCVGLKFGEFKPAYLGQLSAYLRILDSNVKKVHENPSIGIVLCKSANKAFVEFLIQGYDNPMGVATYKTTDEIRKLLPSEEKLLKLLELRND